MRARLLLLVYSRVTVTMLAVLLLMWYLADEYSDYFYMIVKIEVLMFPLALSRITSTWSTSNREVLHSLSFEFYLIALSMAIILILADSRLMLLFGIERIMYLIGILPIKFLESKRIGKNYTVYFLLIELVRIIPIVSIIVWGLDLFALGFLMLIIQSLYFIVNKSVFKIIRHLIVYRRKYPLNARLISWQYIALVSNKFIDATIQKSIVGYALPTALGEYNKVAAPTLKMSTSIHSATFLPATPVIFNDSKWRNKISKSVLLFSLVVWIGVFFIALNTNVEIYLLNQRISLWESLAVIISIGFSEYLIYFALRFKNNTIRLLSLISKVVYLIVTGYLVYNQLLNWTFIFGYGLTISIILILSKNDGNS